jgi:hypothetical protein
MRFIEDSNKRLISLAQIEISRIMFIIGEFCEIQIEVLFMTSFQQIFYLLLKENLNLLLLSQDIIKRLINIEEARNPMQDVTFRPFLLKIL